MAGADDVDACLMSSSDGMSFKTGGKRGVCVLRVRPALETFFMSRVCLKWKKVRDVRRRLKKNKKMKREGRRLIFDDISKTHTQPRKGMKKA